MLLTVKHCLDSSPNIFVLNCLENSIFAVSWHQRSCSGWWNHLRLQEGSWWKTGVCACAEGFRLWALHTPGAPLRCQLCPRGTLCDTTAEWAPCLPWVFRFYKDLGGWMGEGPSWHSCNGWTNEQWFLNTLVIHIILNPEEKQTVTVTCLYSISGVILLKCVFSLSPSSPELPGISLKDTIPI